MKPILLMAILLASLQGCSHLSPMRSLLLRNQDFRAGNGAFIFRDLVVNGDTLPGSWNIKGFVRNNTNEDWRRVQFNFEFYDETWNNLDHYIDGKVTFIAHLLMNRDEQSFTTNYFHIRGKEESLRRISKYKIIYKNIYYGKQIFIMVQPWKNLERLFEDQFIKILFSISETQIGISLHNKMNTPIKIDWNNVSYVDIRGVAHGVVHTGEGILKEIGHKFRQSFLRPR